MMFRDINWWFVTAIHVACGRFWGGFFWKVVHWCIVNGSHVQERRTTKHGKPTISHIESFVLTIFAITKKSRGKGRRLMGSFLANPSLGKDWGWDWDRADGREKEEGAGWGGGNPILLHSFPVYHEIEVLRQGLRWTEWHTRLRTSPLKILKDHTKSEKVNFQSLGASLIFWRQRDF